MINEENTAVITYIDENYQENLEYDFLPSLRKIAGYRGRIIIIDYGIDSDRAIRLKEKYGVEIRRYAKDISMFSIRYRHIAEIAESLDEYITTILITDSGDIWYQNSISRIFELSENAISCVQEDRVIGEDEWTGKCINNIPAKYKTEFLYVTGGSRVKNSGVICGNRNIIIPMFKRIYMDIINCGVEFFGIDQLYFIYEWCRLNNVKKVILDEIFNYVLVSHKDEYVISENDEVVSVQKGRVTVVHNAGGNWRALKRPFANQSENYEQYVIENVYKIADK